MNKLFKITIVLLISLLTISSCTESMHSDSGLTSSIRNNPDLFVKWIYAHNVQGQLHFPPDVPSKGFSWSNKTWDEEDYYKKRDKWILVPIEKLIPYITITDTEYVTNNIIKYWLHLNEEGQALVIASKGEYISEGLCSFIKGGRTLTLQIEDNQVFLIPTTIAPIYYK